MSKLGLRKKRDLFTITQKRELEFPLTTLTTNTSGACCVSGRVLGKDKDTYKANNAIE